MGMRCSDTAIIHFDNVRIPAENIIGDEGMGFTYQMMQVTSSDIKWLKSKLKSICNKGSSSDKNIGVFISFCFILSYPPSHNLI